MSRFNRAISLVFWVLGLLITAAAVIARILRPIRSIVEDRVEVRSLLWLAAVCFLATIATWAVARPAKE